MLLNLVTGRTRTSGPEQLTLDDWARTLAASVDEPTAHPAALGIVRTPTPRPPEDGPAPRQPAARELLETPGALLTRTHLRDLGLERRAIDAVFRRLPVVALPGYSRPLVHAEEYLSLIAEHTYRDDRVRPTHA